MKQFFTSSFSKIKNNDKALSIARWSPKWFVGRRLLILAPSVMLLIGFKNKEISEKTYTEIYTKQLDQIDFAVLLNDIPEESIFSCYEPKNQFCHRHILREYINKNYGHLFCITEL